MITQTLIDTAVRLTESRRYHRDIDLFAFLRVAQDRIEFVRAGLRSRRELRELTADTLEDIGLTRDDIERAASASLWRWRR